MFWKVYAPWSFRGAEEETSLQQHPGLFPEPQFPHHGFRPGNWGRNFASAAPGVFPRPSISSSWISSRERRKKLLFSSTRFISQTLHFLIVGFVQGTEEETSLQQHPVCFPDPPFPHHGFRPGSGGRNFSSAAPSLFPRSSISSSWVLSGEWRKKLLFSSTQFVSQILHFLIMGFVREMEKETSLQQHPVCFPDPPFPHHGFRPGNWGGNFSSAAPAVCFPNLHFLIMGFVRGTEEETSLQQHPVCFPNFHFLIMGFVLLPLIPLPTSSAFIALASGQFQELFFWGGGGDFFLLLYLALLHLPPLRFHCADGCWDRTQDRCN